MPNPSRAAELSEIRTDVYELHFSFVMNYTIGERDDWNTVDSKFEKTAFTAKLIDATCVNCSIRGET